MMIMMTSHDHNDDITTLLAQLNTHTEPHKLTETLDDI